MRWLAITLALLGASAALVSGLYLRDRDTSAWLPPGPTIARHDALAVAADLGGTCPRECKVKLVGHPQQQRLAFAEALGVRAFADPLDVVRS